MSRHFTFSRAQHDVPVEVVEVLDERARVLSLPMVLIGAAARDLCVHAPLAESPTRTTNDVDIAIAVPHGEEFARFTSPFDAVKKAEHKFVVLGIEVDIVPFGGVESDGEVTFRDGSVLDVVGLREAMASPDPRHAVARPDRPGGEHPGADRTEDPGVAGPSRAEPQGRARSPRRALGGIGRAVRRRDVDGG